MKILLVRLSSMGDLIHTLPAVEDLSKQLPNVELHWLAESAFSDIACLHPFVKKIHKMSWRQWRKNITKKEVRQNIKLLRKNLRQEQFDFVLDSQGLIKSAIFAKFAYAPIYGLDGKSAREPCASWLYTKKFAIQKNKDAVWRNRELFCQIFDYQMPSECSFGLKVPSEAALENLPKDYITVLHATSRDSKLWPEQNWMKLLQKLYDTYAYPVLLPWGNETEKERAKRIASILPFAKVCCKMNLLQASYLLNNSLGIVGVDTGLLHLANALDKPVVGIYTDSNPIKTGVQESEIAKNLGGIGCIPDVDSVYELFSDCLSAHKAV